MGMEKSVLTNFGFVAEKAYLRVVGVRFMYAQRVADIQVQVYYNKSSRDGGRDPIVSNNYFVDNRDGTFDQYFSPSVLDVPGNNIVAQAYRYLKTLPEYSEAIDILEE